MEYKEIDWEIPFDPAYGILRIPPNLIFYRGYDLQYPSVSDKPAYYSGIHIANAYSKINGRALGAFTNTRQLRLLDVRFMKILLKELFDTTYSPDNTSFATTLSFGLCSLYHQLQLAKNRYEKEIPDGFKALHATLKLSLYEQPGVRIAETTNDAETIGFLSTVFKGFIDGFVSPRMVSAFHVEKEGTMSPELIIFNPHDSSIQQLNGIPNRTPSITFNQIFLSQFGKTISISKLHFSFYQNEPQYGGVTDGSLPSIEVINNELHEDSEIRGLFERGVKAGKKWKRDNSFFEKEGTVPTLKIKSFL